MTDADLLAAAVRHLPKIIEKLYAHSDLDDEERSILAECLRRRLTLPDAQRQIAVLDVLDQGVGEFCYSFSRIISEARENDRELTRDEVRDACRALKAKGLAYFSHMLWADDGQPAGSGYGITREGRALLRSMERT